MIVRHMIVQRHKTHDSYRFSRRIFISTRRNSSESTLNFRPGKCEETHDYARQSRTFPTFPSCLASASLSRSDTRNARTTFPRCCDEENSTLTTSARGKGMKRDGKRTTSLNSILMFIINDRTEKITML